MGNSVPVEIHKIIGPEASEALKIFNQWKARKSGWTSHYFLEFRCGQILAGPQEIKTNRIGSTEQ